MHVFSKQRETSVDSRNNCSESGLWAIPAGVQSERFQKVGMMMIFGNKLAVKFVRELRA